MNKAEAEIIAEILMTADGGCYICASNLFKNFNAYFHGFEDTLNAVWGKEYTPPDGWREVG